MTRRQRDDLGALLCMLCVLFACGAADSLGDALAAAVTRAAS